MMFSTTTTSMQGFFKNAVSTARYSSKNNDDIHGHRRNEEGTSMTSSTSTTTNSHHHTSLLSAGTINYFLHHNNSNSSSNYDSSSSKSKVRIHGLSEHDIKMMISDTDTFHSIQEQLRKRHSQTNSLVKQIGIDLIHEKYLELQYQKKLVQQQAVMEQKKLQIARELTEARIKARQALNLPASIQKKDSYIDDDDKNNNDNVNNENKNEYDDHTDNNEDGNNIMTDQYQHGDNSSNSPTSVMAGHNSSITIDADKMMMMTTAPSFDSSEDGDIQEVIDENDENY